MHRSSLACKSGVCVNYAKVGQTVCANPGDAGLTD
jgi:hypothetical protein